MLASLKKFLTEMISAPSENSGLDRDELRLAEAALMFHVIAADGSVTDAERSHMAAILETNYNLTAKETSELIEEAQNADNEAIDLYKFTTVLKNRLDYPERLAIIRNLWEMVFADGELNELEDNIVWRVADLLNIDGRDRVNLKIAVKEEREKPVH